MWINSSECFENRGTVVWWNAETIGNNTYTRVVVLSDDRLYYALKGDAKTAKLIEKLKSHSLAECQRQLTKMDVIELEAVTGVEETGHGLGLTITFMDGEEERKVGFFDPNGTLKLFKRLHARVAPKSRIRKSKKAGSWRVLAEALCITVPVSAIVFLVNYLVFWRGQPSGPEPMRDVSLMISSISCFVLFVGYFMFRQNRLKDKRWFAVSSAREELDVGE